MTAQEKRKGGGSKLSRSETVTVRLDPKLLYLLELAARKQRRTVSSFIEWAVETSLRHVEIYQGTGFGGDENLTLADEADRLWDVDEAERFARLAITYPELLTYEEQEKRKLLFDSMLLAPAMLRDSQGVPSWNWRILQDQVFPVLRRHWSSLKEAHSQGEEAGVEWAWTTSTQVKAGFVYKGFPTTVKQDDDDSDIPF